MIYSHNFCLSCRRENALTFPGRPWAAVTILMWLHYVCFAWQPQWQYACDSIISVLPGRMPEPYWKGQNKWFPSDLFYNFLPAHRVTPGVRTFISILLQQREERYYHRWIKYWPIHKLYYFCRDPISRSNAIKKSVREWYVWTNHEAWFCQNYINLPISRPSTVITIYLDQSWWLIWAYFKFDS